MDRKSFLKNSLVATGSLLLGGAAIYRFLNDKEPASTDDRKNTSGRYEKDTCHNERRNKTRQYRPADRCIH